MNDNSVSDIGLYIALGDSGEWSMKLDLNLVEETKARLGREAFVAIAEDYIRSECVRLGLEDDIELWTLAARALAKDEGPPAL
ncbi:hypothetical protein [Aquamicrobium sp. NLF2-7]|uniref:hypothetical protein n=1 Tax=Aquamicrobium sp. NLF2-7 TaxID=2918753 RepID=UPI001EFB069C|nr:hypothetical protein [Aquamicrobium sp. NLF2-7]